MSPRPLRKTLRARVRAGVLAAAALPSLCPACVCGGGGPPLEVAKDFGPVEQAPADLRPYLALARAVVERRGRQSVPAPPPSPGRRVMLELWRPGTDPAVTTGSGATLADAVTVAAERLAAAGPVSRLARLELDVPTSVEGQSLARDFDEPATALGTRGAFVADDEGRVAAVLPGEIALRQMYREGNKGLDRARVRALLSARSGMPEPRLDQMRTYRFAATAVVESAAHDAALPVFRGMVVHPPQATPDLLLAAVRRGADYLVRSLGPDGRYVYMYHPVDERDDGGYGMLRHSGTTYALLEAFEELHEPVYLARAELALLYLEARLRVDPSSGGKFIVDTNDEEQQKVGGAGLALLAFAKHAAVTGQRAHLETMRALARYIEAQQLEDGHFRCNADLEAQAGKKLKREPAYYPGEAALALLRLYAFDPLPSYLSTARRAADWIIRVRDAAASEDNQEHDHWISYALNDLYRVTHDQAHLDHAYKIARAIQRKQHGPEAAAPDLVGTFYEGQTTAASTRVEALASDIALARFAVKPDDWLVGSARQAAAWMLGQQFDPDNAYWVKDPARSQGGVRDSVLSSDVRIDFVQHAMSAWLHLARELRDPAYGATGVPSQDPVR